ncbi:MAG: PIG-L family deacetylase [Candidatus Omnitrophica bacterium]|nr:PIG-L family deacetylase [Candidatus Omnitrophota bacterium]
MSKRKILIIAAHMDDEALGCAGAILKHKACADKVSVIFVAHRIYNHQFNDKKSEIEKSHALKAKKVLGYDDVVFLGLDDERLDKCLQDIIIPLERHVKAIKPQIIYLPFRQDNNQDHRAVFDAARVVLRPAATAFIKELNMYEVPSSTEQSPQLSGLSFLPNYYIDIGRFIDKKLKAMMCYETERRKYPHPRSEKAIRVLAQKRGTEIGYDYAEAFMCIRRKWEK